jgi:VanZ family protein
MTRSDLAIALQRLRPWLRAAAWFCLGVIVILSLVPGYERPQTGYPGKVEHMIAYAGAGLFAVFGFERSRTRHAFWALAATLSFLLEYLQHFSPGRSPDILDAVASSFGLTMGMALAAPLLALFASRPE